MSWTNGTWADVAIGDTVLGGDGYPWSVTDGLINHFDMYGKGESLRVTMQRDGAGSRTGDVLASKTVKYQAGEPRGVVISCNDCQYAGKPSCGLHAPASPGVKMLADALGMPVPPRLPVPAFADAGEATEPTYTVAETCEAWGGCDEHPAPAAPKVAPYVEYDEAERAAASALKGAGLTMTVIERVMTLDGLIEHLTEVHGAEIPDTGTLTRIEYRSRLADLHFELHALDQERGQKWAPRGRTPHVHPVMDRSMEDATPRSLTRRR